MRPCRNRKPPFSNILHCNSIKSFSPQTFACLLTHSDCHCGVFVTYKQHLRDQNRPIQCILSYCHVHGANVSIAGKLVIVFHVPFKPLSVPFFLSRSAGVTGYDHDKEIPSVQAATRRFIICQ